MTDYNLLIAAPAEKRYSATPIHALDVQYVYLERNTFENIYYSYREGAINADNVGTFTDRYSSFKNIVAQKSAVYNL